MIGSSVTGILIRIWPCRYAIRNEEGDLGMSSLVERVLRAIRGLGSRIF